MQLSIALDDEKIVTVEVRVALHNALWISLINIPVQVDPDTDVETLHCILEVETGIPAKLQQLIHNGVPLEGSQTLGGQGVQANDLLALRKKTTSRAGTARTSREKSATTLAADGSAVNPQAFMDALRMQPESLERLPSNLVAAIKSNNAEGFQTELRAIYKEQTKARKEAETFMRLANEDPFNVEVQRRLEEAIQQKNVAENFEAALEHNPEAFGSVHMLYVDIEVNCVPLKAFVDSGAQTTIMNRSCAEKCGLLRLMDKRFAGTAVGVGSQPILGRVHLAPLKAGGSFFPSSITVLERGPDMLFGLDNLKRHQCCIDLAANVLRFSTSGVSLPFLPEHRIPKDFTGHGAEGSISQPLPEQTQGKTPPKSATEDSIEKLKQLGFSQEQCVQALQAADGDVDAAASLLFGGWS